jgi:hypothetical protein
MRSEGTPLLTSSIALVRTNRRDPLKRRFTTSTQTGLPFRGFAMATSGMDNSRQSPIKGFDSTRRVTLGTRVITIVVKTAHRLGSLNSRRRVTEAVEETPAETGTVLTRVEVVPTRPIMERVMKPPCPPPEQRKTPSDEPCPTTDEMSAHAADPDETRLETRADGTGPVVHTGLQHPIPIPIGKKVLVVPQNI